MKISVTSIHWGNVGLPGGAQLSPGQTVSLEVTQEEYDAWSKSNHVKISAAVDTSPSSNAIQDNVRLADNQGRGAESLQVGSAPGRQRAGRPGKAKP